MEFHGGWSAPSFKTGYFADKQIREKMRSTFLPKDLAA